MKKDGIKLFIVALASFLMLVFCIVAASPDSTLQFIDPTPANYTQEQDFTWGVLAINTHKSIYLPNEAASIGIAVLDNEGHMVCDADVTLTITDPSNNETELSTANGLINVSPQCCVYGVTNLPDFYTNYTGDGAGTYVMNLTVTAVTADGTKSITDEFTVQNSVDFDVARDGATRIYPSVPYVMNFTIKANKDYDGLIREYVPASFVITPQDGLIVTTVGDTSKILTWTKKLVKGETYNIYYEFDAPVISPYLFTLGALEIGNWKEARKWMSASDAPVTETLRPNAAGTYQQWLTFCGTGSHWNYTADQSDATGVEITGDITKKETENLDDPTFPDGSPINSVTVYARMNVLNAKQTQERARIITRTGGTDYESAYFTVIRDTWTDYSVEYTENPGGGSWTKAQIAALEVGSRAHGGLSPTETLQCSEYWVVVDCTPPTPPTWESYKEKQHNTVWGTEENPYDRDTHVVYMAGEGFKTRHAYKVAYYDAEGNKAHEVTGSSSRTGALSSEYDFTENSGAAAGTWHSVVLDTTGDVPDTYNAAIGDVNYVIDDDFVVKQSAIREPTWESYKELGHSNVWGQDAEHAYNSDYHIVYMYGKWFETSHSYKVGYYDGTSGGGGHLVGAGVGGTSNVDGEFSSQCDCMSTGATEGTWHSVVLDTSGNIPDTYSAAIRDEFYVTDDDFEVAESAIPEFPTVIAAIAVCMLCAVSYVVMRRKEGKGAQSKKSVIF